MVDTDKVSSDLKVDQIVLAKIKDSLGIPRIESVNNFPSYSFSINDPLVLRGIDEAELRVIGVDNNNKQVKLAFHASLVLHPRASTGRIIMLTYSSMRNTVLLIFKNLLSFNR